MNFDDEVMDILILCPLPERWNSLFMDVGNSIFVSKTLKFDDVIGVILSEEMRGKSTGETSGNVLTMDIGGIQRERGKSLGYRSSSRKGRSKPILGNMECWSCGKRGHMKKDCGALKKKGDGHQ